MSNIAPEDRVRRAEKKAAAAWCVTILIALAVLYFAWRWSWILGAILVTIAVGFAVLCVVLFGDLKRGTRECISCRRPNTSKHELCDTCRAN